MIPSSSTALALWVSTGRGPVPAVAEVSPRRCPLAQASVGCWHRVAADAPAVEGPFSLCSASDKQISSLCPQRWSSSSIILLLPGPGFCCPCPARATPLPLLLPQLQALPLFVLNSLLAFLDPSSSSLGAFGILILLSNVSADPLRLLTDGDLIIVPSTPSSSSLRNGLEQAEQCRPLCLSLWTGIYCRSLEARGKLRPIFPCLEMCFGQLNRPGE